MTSWSRGNPFVTWREMCIRDRLNVGQCVTLLADDVGIGKLLVQGEPVVQHGGIAVNVDDVVARIHTVVVGEGQLPELQYVNLGIRVENSIVVAVYAIVRYEAGVGGVIALFAGSDTRFVSIEDFLLGG